ncbi:MAG: DUF1992 domain-containing protein [Desulfovibrio sp.]|jgi:hypothetical protein|nr:DUF1992 domain-containing protein [Desulfovibrio sp.]
MDAISFIAERKIEQAIEDGVLDNLPGMGNPLNFENLSHLPPELRMAYTILKNGGYIEKLPDVGRCVSAGELLEHCPDEGDIYGKMQRLNVLLRRVKRAQQENAPGNHGCATLPEACEIPYLEQLINRIRHSNVSTNTGMPSSAPFTPSTPQV